MSAWDVFHDVPFDFFVFQNGEPVVDEDRRRRSLEVIPVIIGKTFDNETFEIKVELNELGN